MILLQVHPVWLTVTELERDAPGPVDMDRVTRRAMPSQAMEIESGKIEVGRLCRCVEGVQHQKRPSLQIRPDPAALPRPEELSKAFMPPAPYHVTIVNTKLSHVNYEVTPLYEEQANSSTSFKNRVQLNGLSIVAEAPHQVRHSVAALPGKAPAVVHGEDRNVRKEPPYLGAWTCLCGLDPVFYRIVSWRKYDDD